jgi:hypothetical protein
MRTIGTFDGIQLPRQPVQQLIYYCEDDFNDDDPDCDDDI